MAATNIVAIGNPIFQAFDPTTGQFLTNGILYVVKPGGDLTSLQTIYGTVIDAENQTNPIANPVILSAQGTAFVVVTGPCKLVLQNSAGTQEWFFDNFNSSGGNIYDDNGNALLLFTAQNGAQNQVTISNAVSGAHPSITATGNDTNIGLDIDLTGNATLNLNTGTSGTVAMQGNATVAGNTTITGNTTNTGNITTSALLTGANLELTTGQIQGSNGLPVQSVTSVANAVNYISSTNAIAASPPAFIAAGSDTNIALQLQGKGTSGVQSKGDVSATVIPAGYIGQVITVTNTVSGISPAVTNNVVNFSLPAGHWLIFGGVITNAQASTSTVSLSLVNGTLDSAFLTSLTQVSGSGSVNISAPVRPVVTAITTTIYLVVNITNSVAYTATGTVNAVRIA